MVVIVVVGIALLHAAGKAIHKLERVDVVRVVNNSDDLVIDSCSRCIGRTIALGAVAEEVGVEKPPRTKD